MFLVMSLPLVGCLGVGGVGSGDANDNGPILRNMGRLKTRLRKTSQRLIDCVSCLSLSDENQCEADDRVLVPQTKLRTRRDCESVVRWWSAGWCWWWGDGSQPTANGPVGGGRATEGTPRPGLRKRSIRSTFL